MKFGQIQTISLSLYSVGCEYNGTISSCSGGAGTPGGVTG